DRWPQSLTNLLARISPSRGQEPCAQVLPCPPNRLWPNDLPAARDDPMSGSRLHAFSNHKPVATLGVLGPACPLSALCPLLARVFGPAPRLANCRDARPASLRL